MPNTRYSPWCRPQRCAWRLVSNTSEPVAHGFFQCQNGLPKDCYDDGWSALSGWPWAWKVGPGDEAFYRLSRSFFNLTALILEPRNWSLAVSAAGALYYQCWLNKISHWLAWFEASFRTGRAVGKREFCKWGPNIKAIGWPKRIDLIEWYSLVRTADKKEFKCSQPKAFLFYLCFSKENEIVHLQPHSPCSSNNQSKNNTWKAPMPNWSAWSSNSLYPLNGVGCCDWWAHERCACNFLDSVAIFWKSQQ